MADASSLLGSPEIAGAWVNPSGMGKRTMNAVAYGQFGSGSAQATSETPNFGGFGYLGVSATELLIVKGRKGLIGLKMTDDVVAKVPRGDVVSVELGEGKITAPLTIVFSGGQWNLEVARAHRGAAQRVVAELTG